MSTSTISWDSSSYRSSRRGFRGRRHDSVREPDALEAHVRFDERGSGNGIYGQDSKAPPIERGGNRYA
ncbi:hypothetical protein [Xenorhabdus sp. TH1]|uniref:hypothetical protein n=1 Tax=Xenorhabdus sp. TH1 TaxID=3130166 RepID=UPI0030D3D4C6